MTTLAVAKNEPVYKLEQAKLQENKSVSCLLQDDRKTGFIAGIGWTARVVALHRDGGGVKTS